MDATNMMLEVRDLTKIYPNTGTGHQGGVREANFALEKGAFFTLLGPSGCGKTTTLRCIAGLERPDGGRIMVGQGSIASKEPERERHSRSLEPRRQ